MESNQSTGQSLEQPKTVLNLKDKLRDELSHIKKYNNLSEELKERIRNWVAILRTNTYRQAQSYLREIHQETGETIGHCCIGVYGEAICGMDYSEEVGTDLNTSRLVLKGEKTERFEEDFHLFEEMGDALANANDSGEVNFSDIADVVEEVLL